MNKKSSDTNKNIEKNPILAQAMEYNQNFD